MVRRVPADVAEVLVRCSTEGAMLFLPQAPIDPGLYRRTDHAIRGLGGTWQLKDAGYLFAADPAPRIAEAVAQAGSGRRRPVRTVFVTPGPIADRMVSLAQLRGGEVILAPNAGSGRPLRRIPAGLQCRIKAVEPHPRRRAALEALAARRAGAIDVIEGDFLDVRGAVGAVDVVLLNPPGRQGIEQTLAAWDLLRPGGRLVAILSDLPWKAADRPSREFRAWIDAEEGTVELLPPDTFRASGPLVPARLVAVTRQAA